MRCNVLLNFADFSQLIYNTSKRNLQPLLVTWICRSTHFCLIVAGLTSLACISSGVYLLGFSA